MIAEAYFLDAPNNPLSKRDLPLCDPAPAEALVEVKACGLCHTDLGYANGSVAPRHPLPLVLGHEVTGRVVAAGERFAHLVGSMVIVPAILPCGDCVFCRSGRANACRKQKMPGNDIHGGFSTHMLVPAGALITLDDAPPEISIEQIAVVADATSTAYQAVIRSGLKEGDAAFVVGAGGVGSFVIQIAHALGAHVAACDISDERLQIAAEHGAEHTLNVRERDSRSVRQELRDLAGTWGVPSLRYRILECSGTSAGQLLAFGLLAPAATLVQVGYTRDKIEVRLSNLMAFDATIHGTWGCPPERYPEILRLVYDGKVVLGPFVERAPMSEVNRLLDDMSHHRLTRRMILDPHT